MAICWKITDDGAFICGDDESRVTSYSYPTSTNAKNASRASYRGVAFIEKFAGDVLTAEGSLRTGAEHEAQYDADNWRKINFGSDA